MPLTGVRHGTTRLSSGNVEEACDCMWKSNQRLINGYLMWRFSVGGKQNKMCNAQVSDRKAGGGGMHAGREGRYRNTQAWPGLTYRATRCLRHSLDVWCGHEKSKFTPMTNNLREIKVQRVRLGFYQRSVSLHKCMCAFPVLPQTIVNHRSELNCLQSVMLSWNWAHVMWPGLNPSRRS